MSSPSPSLAATADLSLAQLQLEQWANAHAGGKQAPSQQAENIASAVDLRELGAGAAPAALKAWVARALQQPASELRLRPIAAALATSSSSSLPATHAMDDSAGVISVARSFGLSTTTGARGDAVSYVLRVQDGVAASSAGANSTPAATSATAASTVSLLGVVKVIKSRNVLQQELCALQLIRSLMPTPRHAFYPRLLAAEWALIPTAIPPAAANGGTTSSAGAFARPYSVSSMGSSSVGSISSTAANASYCQGGLVLMECAPGVPLSELFSRIGSEAVGSPDRAARVSELSVAIREAARALAELHVGTSVLAADPRVVRPFIQDAAAQVRDMLGKLALPEYAQSITKWRLDLPLITSKLDQIMQQTMDEPGGNMLWDGAQQRITLIDLPTMLQATLVEPVMSESEGEAKIPQGKFKLTAETTTTTTMTPAAAPAPATVAATSAASVPRHSAVCLPPASTSFLLSGCALAARDACHFERKLDSHGSRRGMSEGEVADAQADFWEAYSTAGGTVTQPARRFFRLRSLMGEITQLIKYEPEGMTESMREQLQQIIDGSGGEQIGQGKPGRGCRTSS